MTIRVKSCFTIAWESTLDKQITNMQYTNEAVSTQEAINGLLEAEAKQICNAKDAKQLVCPCYLLLLLLSFWVRANKPS